MSRLHEASCKQQWQSTKHSGWQWTRFTLTVYSWTTPGSVLRAPLKPHTHIHQSTGKTQSPVSKALLTVSPALQSGDMEDYGRTKVENTFLPDQLNSYISQTDSNTNNAMVPAVAPLTHILHHTHTHTQPLTPTQ